MERLDNSKLSPVQKHIVNMISRDKYVAVVGGPGTGKTVLAMSGMDKSSGRKQILLTYSNPLSKMIKGCNVESNTVHSFCWWFGAAIEERRQAFRSEYDCPDENESRQRQRFNEVINREYGYKLTGWPRWDKLYRDFSSLPESDRRELQYDDIFIDEGQDLPDEAYGFFCKIADRVIVTYDDAQEVGRDREDIVPQIIRKAGIECNRIVSALSLQESFYDLIDNFRNTVAIEKVAKLFYNNYANNALSLRVSTCRRHYGEKPSVCFSAPTQALIDKIADDTYQMNKQTGIIIPDRETFDVIKTMLDNSVAKNIVSREKFFYKYGKADNMKDTSIDTVNLNQTGVFLITFKSAKGMEFDDVYIFNCQNVSLGTDAGKNQFYVAVTRAKERIYFYFDCLPENKYPVLDIVNANKELFKFEEK